MAAQTEPKLSELVSDAVRDVQALINGQVELAKAEIAQSAKRGATGGGMIGLAVFMALFALLMLAFSAAFGLVAAGLPNWAAFLVIGILMLLVTAMLGFIAYRQFNKITGPVLAKEELDKTKKVFADRRASKTAAAVALVSATAEEASEPESSTVFPSYGGTPPAA